jgi:hypothetical protein
MLVTPFTTEGIDEDKESYSHDTPPSEVDNITGGGDPEPLLGSGPYPPAKQV